jgi:hypothetical protein
MTEIAPLQDFFANNQPIAELADFFDQDFDEFGRPERTEDRLVRHRGDGRPKIWVPRDATLTAPGETIVLSTDMRLSNGMTLPAGTSVSFPGTEVPHPKAGKQVFYSRPSSWGDVTEDRTKISEWRQRMAVEGFARSKRLRLEWSALPGVDWDDSVRKAAARRLIDEAVLMAGPELVQLVALKLNAPGFRGPLYTGPRGGIERAYLSELPSKKDARAAVPPHAA